MSHFLSRYLRPEQKKVYLYVGCYFSYLFEVCMARGEQIRVTKILQRFVFSFFTSIGNKKCEGAAIDVS